MSQADVSYRKARLQTAFSLKGFGSKWRTWFQGCLSTATFSVIVNGEPITWFRSQRSIRQVAALVGTL